MTVFDGPFAASLLLVGPNGGEVRNVLGIRVAYEPSVLEKERVKVNRAPVNGDHNCELGQSARHGGTVALQLLFRETNHNDPIARLWIDIEPPSLAVMGRSAELLFGLATYLHVGRASSPEGVPNCGFMATGSLDRIGNVGSVDAVAAKVRAALASNPDDGTMLFYPRVDEVQIDDDLRVECRDRGLILRPVDRIDEALDSLGVPLLGAWPSSSSPFRALEAYETSYSRVFFGRRREIAALTALLDTRCEAGRPGAMIIGASGAGKSSFCLAGVLPALARAKSGLQYAVWRPRDAGTGKDGDVTDENQLSASIASRWRARDANQSGLIMASSPSATGRLNELPACIAAPAGSCQIFIVDQFEELFTLNFTPEARIAFARFLQSLQARGVWVIGTLRSEFYANYLELSDQDGSALLTPLFEGDGQFNLARMGREAFSQVIIRPAQLAGLKFEQRADGVSLDQILIADAIATDDALPLLGFALQNLYDEADYPAATKDRNEAQPRTLAFIAYQRLGGLNGAIGKVAAQAFDSLDEVARATLPALLSSLAIPSPDGARETARPTPIDQWPAGSEARRLIDALISIRVLVSEQGSTPDAPAIVRVAHEALFTHWELAVQLLNESRQSRFLIEDFRQRAKLWDDDNQPREALLSSKRDVENARAVRGLMPPSNDNGPLIAFIDRSITASRRRLQIMYSTTTVVALALLGLSGATLVANGRLTVEIGKAERSALAARAAKDEAVKQTRIAREEKRNAINLAELAREAANRAELAAVAEQQQRNDANRQRDVAIAATRVAMEQRQLSQAQTLEARRQRSRAVAQLAEAAIERGDAMTGILLARSQLQPGDEANWTGEAQSALLHGLLENREIATLSFDPVAKLSASFSPDGRRILTVSSDGSVRVWTLDGGHAASISLVGHTDLINSARFSPDGHHVVTASNDHTARVWTLDGDDPKSVILSGHTDTVKSAVFSPDGRRVVTASNDHTARVWTLDGDDPKSVILSGHTDTVKSATFSPDGRRVVTASSDQTARVWTLEGDRAIPIVLSGHTGEIEGAEFSPDGRGVVTASDDHTARIWTLDGSRASSVELSGHTGSVWSAVFSPDGRKVVTASVDHSARVWSLDGDHAKSLVLTGHTDLIWRAEFSPDSRRVLTASSDGTARVWTLDGDSFTSVELSGHTGSVWSAVFSPDGRKVATASIDGSVRIWTLDGDRSASVVLNGHAESVFTAKFSPEGRRVVTASRDGTARVWALDGDRAKPLVLSSDSKVLTSAVFSPDGRRVLTASREGTAQLWTLDGDRAISIVLGTPSHVARTEFITDGRQIVTASFDGLVQIWTLEGDLVTSTLLPRTFGEIWNSGFSADGRRIMIPSSDGTIQVWNLGGERATSVILVGHTAEVVRAQINSDGRRVITASRDGTVRAWTLDGSHATSLVLSVPNTGRLDFARFSADGRKIVTASPDGTAWLWSLDGDHVTSVVLVGHTQPVLSAAFSPDGTRLVTRSFDGTVRVWALRGNRATSVVLPETRVVLDAEFSPDGQSVVTASYDGTARVWSIPFGSQLLEWSNQVITRCLTMSQLEKFGLTVQTRSGTLPCR